MVVLEIWQWVRHRGLKQTLCAPEPRDPTEAEPELCLRVSWGGTGQQWMLQGQGFWVQQTWVWHKPSWRRSPLTPPQSRQNLHRTGETDSGRAQTEPCVHQDPGERSSDPTRLTQTCRECPGVSDGGVGWCWPAAGPEARSVAVHAQDLLRRPRDPHYLHRSVASGQTGWECSPAHQQKMGLNMYWATH